MDIDSATKTPIEDEESFWKEIETVGTRKRKKKGGERKVVKVRMYERRRRRK